MAGWLLMMRALVFNRTIECLCVAAAEGLLGSVNSSYYLLLFLLCHYSHSVRAHLGVGCEISVIMMSVNFGLCMLLL